MGFFTATVRRKRNMACFVFFNLDPVLTFSTDEEDDRSYIPYVDFQNLLVFILTCIYYFKIRLILCAIRLLNRGVLIPKHLFKSVWPYLWVQYCLFQLL